MVYGTAMPPGGSSAPLTATLKTAVWPSFTAAGSGGLMVTR